MYTCVYVYKCVHIYNKYIYIYIYNMHEYKYSMTTNSLSSQSISLFMGHTNHMHMWCVHPHQSPSLSFLEYYNRQPHTDTHKKKTLARTSSSRPRTFSLFHTRGGLIHIEESYLHSKELWIYSKNKFGKFVRYPSHLSVYTRTLLYVFMHRIHIYHYRYVVDTFARWMLHLPSSPHWDQTCACVCVCVCVYACVCTFMSSFRSFCSSNLSSTADARRSATPPPGTMPSSTAARVALSASTKRSFRSPTSTCNNVCVSARERERRVKSGEGERESEREKER